MCIFTVKSVIKYYTEQNTAVYTCLLDDRKAFDRVNHWTLFAKLIDTQATLLIVRVLLFWYQMQNVCIKWGNSYSHYFTICNGVRQGGILSPRLFALYVNQLTDRLLSCNAGCYNYNRLHSITLPHSFPNSTNVIPHSPFPIQYLMKFVSILKLSFDIESRTILLQPIMLLMRWPYVLKRFFTSMIDLLT